MKNIILTFDLEEFDLPLEFNQKINSNEMFNISNKGLLNIISLLKKYNITSTFFTTLKFAEKYPNLIKDLSKKHEIACHGNNHSDNYSISLNSLRETKKRLEKIILKKVYGFRAPRFQIKDISKLSDFDFKYDSSIHPTWIPKRYFNLFKKRKPYKINKIIEVPISTLPILRLPIFWLAFKNFSLLYSKLFTKLNFLSSDYTMLFFHPWEFTNLDKINIPKYIKKPLDKKLENYIKFCKNNNYNFITIKDYLDSKN